MKKHELLQEAIDIVIDCCDILPVIFYHNAEVICFEGDKIRIPLRANANGKIAVLILAPDIEFV